MKSNLLKPGFLSLLTAQFFGAMNDNVLKVVLTFMVMTGGIWAGDLGAGGQGIVGVCFTIPFLLLSGIGGQIADRYSKRDVTLWVKIAEIPIALIALVGFWSGNLWITLLSLVALTCQSAFFGPAKYGMIPELVDESDLSRANGTINMMTNIAVIVGTLIGGSVSDRYFPKVGEVGTPGVLWLPGAALLVVAIAGLAAALFLPRLSPGDRSMKFQWNPFYVYIDAIHEMAKTRFLMVMMAWGYFYLLAGLALLILPEYATVLGVSRAAAAALMGIMGVAIGIGCATAGLISGHQIRPRLVPIGALGLIVFFTLLALVPPPVLGGVNKAGVQAVAVENQAVANEQPVESDAEKAKDSEPKVAIALGAPKVGMIDVIKTNVAGFVFGAGFFAGFYIIPLQALLQKLSPQEERGRFLGTANAVSFTFLTIASIMYALIRSQFGNQPQRIFLLSAILMALGTGFFLWKLRGTGILIPAGQDTGSDSTAASQGNDVDSSESESS